MKHPLLLPGAAILLGAALVLSGCSWLAPPTEPVPALADRQRLGAVESWRLAGRIAVHTEGDAWTADLEWYHGPEGDRMDLTGPFAQRAATIRYRSRYIAFDAADGTHAESDDPDALLLERLGFAVPLDALRYWVLGLPRPGDAVIRPDVPTGEEGFDQAGWALRYAGYRREGEWVLPRKMTARRGAVTLKLVVDNWRSGG